uniref:S26-RNase n=1 Tax=Escherichia virus LS3 TaxID=2743777 RepID=A0A7D5FUS1_9CAUD
MTVGLIGYDYRLDSVFRAVVRPEPLVHAVKGQKSDPVKK